MKGIIFGVGYYWKTVNPYLTDKLEILSYMDNNVKFTPGGDKTYLPEEWKTLEFDKIIICVMDFHTKLEMMNQLLDLGVEKERISFIEGFLKNYNLHIGAVKKNTVKINANNVHVQCENEVEYMIAQEIFAEEEYGFHSKDNYFVVDIGVNIGCASLYFASKDNVTAVYGFEPCKAVYDKAVNNISNNEKDIRSKINIYNIGLGGKDHTEKFVTFDGIDESRGIRVVQDESGHCPASQADLLLKKNNNITELKVRQASRILSEIFSRHKEKCLLKIDCEGAEYEILEDLIGSGELNRVDSIVMEWHVSKYLQLQKMLEQAGFDYLLTKSCRGFGKCYAWKTYKS